MAGMKGRSGGARPGAGRKPKAKPAEQVAAISAAQSPVSQAAPVGSEVLPAVRPLFDGKTRTPIELLELAMNDPAVDVKDRIRAAVAAAQYRHYKLGDGGKKDETEAKAKKASAGRFAPKAAPKLVVNNGG